MRPSVDQYFVRISETVASRSTCLSRRVGCVLVDANNHILATGYNGSPRGMQHCVDVGCLRKTAKPGEALDMCRATHAEQNAMLQCLDVGRIKTAYVTTAPCVTCTKLLLNTSCERIVYVKPYNNPLAYELWTATGRTIEQFQEKLSIEGAFRTYITAVCMGNVEEVLNDKLKEYTPTFCVNPEEDRVGVKGSLEDMIVNDLIDRFCEALEIDLDEHNRNILRRVVCDMSNWR